MNGAERNGSEQETEVVAKPRRRRFTVEYKRTNRPGGRWL